MFFVVEREKKSQTNDNWNFWIWVLFVQKWPFRDAYLSFEKCLAETPISIMFLGARFFGQVVKREILDTPQKREKLDW